MFEGRCPVYHGSEGQKIQEGFAAIGTWSWVGLFVNIFNNVISVFTLYEGNKNGIFSLLTSSSPLCL